MLFDKGQRFVCMFFALHHGFVSVNHLTVQVNNKRFPAGHKHFIFYAELSAPRFAWTPYTKAKNYKVQVALVYTKKTKLKWDYKFFLV